MFPSRIGHHFSFEGPAGAGRGWRLTHRGAKHAGRRAAEAVSGPRPGSLAAADGSGRKPARLPRGPASRPLWIPGAIVVAVLALVGLGGFAVLQAREPDAAAVSTPGVDVVISDRLTVVGNSLVEAFRVEHPDIPIRPQFLSPSVVVDKVNAGELTGVVIDKSGTTNQFIPRANRRAMISVLGQDVLQIVVREEMVEKITSIEDLDPRTYKVGVADPATASGSAAARVLLNNEINTVGFEVLPTATALLDRLSAGDLDAAVIYRSERMTRPQLPFVDLPTESSASIDYPVYRFATDPAAGQFIQFLDSSIRAAEILRAAGLRGAAPTEPGAPGGSTTTTSTATTSTKSRPSRA